MSSFLRSIVGAGLEWMKDGACIGTDVDFHPITGPAVEARTICSHCPVRVDCLDHALSKGEKHGIWGGASERERRKLRGGGFRQLRCRCGLWYVTPIEHPRPQCGRCAPRPGGHF